MEMHAQVRADLRSVCLEALTEKTADGRRAVQLRMEADRMMEQHNKVGQAADNQAIHVYDHGSSGIYMCGWLCI